MTVVILQSNYVPWKGYFDLINEADVFVFYDCVKYTKNDWRNRNKIYTKNGSQWLTIPINATATNQLIKEVEINDCNWQNLHYNSLFYGYKKAPFFHQLEELLKLYLLSNSWVRLSDLNQFLIKYISEKIGINTVFRQSSDFNIKGNKVEKLLSMLNSIGASKYLSGENAKPYLIGSENLFIENNIQLTYKQYPNYPIYKQLGSGFEQKVSILDMIAHIDWCDIKNYIWNNER